MNVLVTSIGSFSADIVIKNLRKEGHRVTGCSVFPREWTAESLLLDSFYQIAHADDPDRYLEDIFRICEEEKIRYVQPLTDIEIDLLDEHRARFEEKGIRLCITDGGNLPVLRNKMKLSRALSEKMTAFRTIPTRRLDEVTEVPEFPVVCKRIKGRSSKGLYFIHSEREWNYFLEGPDRKAYPYIVQPFIEGGILTVDVLRDPESGTKAAVAREELLRTYNGAGLTVRTFRDPKLEEACKKLVDFLNIRGCVNFEFIRSPGGELYLLECNPRFSGGVEFSCMAGYDFVRNHFRCFTGERAEDAGEIKETYIARKYEEYEIT